MERNNHQDLIELLNKTEHTLSKKHQKIATYILHHYQNIMNLSAAKLSAACGVSESTMIRFAYALGYDGYPALQNALQESVRHHLTVVQRFDMSSNLSPQEILPVVLKNDIQNIQKTLENLDRDAYLQAVEALLTAQSIYVVGLRSAAPLAQYLGYYLHYVFDHVHTIESNTADVYDFISRIHEEDLLIGISFPRYSSRTLEAMRYAAEKNAKVIGITDSIQSPLNSVSHICLSAATDMTSFVDSMAAPFSLINALIISLSLYRKKEINAHLKLMEGLWNTHRVYIDQNE